MMSEKLWYELSQELSDTEKTDYLRRVFNRKAPFDPQLTTRIYASEYEEWLCKLLVLIESVFELKFPFQQVDSVLIQNNLMSQDIYADISAGTYTDRLARFETALGLPAHTLVGRGLDLKGKVVDADEESVRWLPEGEVK